MKGICLQEKRHLNLDFFKEKKKDKQWNENLQKMEPIQLTYFFVPRDEELFVATDVWVFQFC